jgi:hypothetical protein
VARIDGGGLLTGGKREKLGHIDRQEEEEDKGDIDGMSGGSHVKEIDYLQKNAKILPKFTQWIISNC